ncbi:unnamed protein product [Dracunculus medinensis]|uniref:SEA domain-containing protein n=1 Tax=Dracunculus medinensis TaxID=318479 RepID=A0A0N4UAH2_DRAME|nr:unnamed protein product [Dracunculus medinensis]
MTKVPIVEPEPEPQPKSTLSNPYLKRNFSFENRIADLSNNFEGNTYETPFSFRITSIEYIRDFNEPRSGKFRKLRDQLLPDLDEIFGAIFTSIYQKVIIERFSKGSVIVDGFVYTTTELKFFEQLATEFEQHITAKGSRIGENDVDPRSISLNGFVSKNYIERIQEGYTSSSSSKYIIGGSIAIGILAVLIVAFAVIAMNNRHSNGSLKLKEGSVMAELGQQAWSNGTSPVNLLVIT